MNAQPLSLPHPTPCPACSKPIEMVWVEPILEETQLEAVAVSCPHCGTSYTLSVKTIARAVALEAIKRLHG